MILYNLAVTLYNLAVILYNLAVTLYNLAVILYNLAVTLCNLAYDRPQSSIMLKFESRFNYILLYHLGNSI